MGESWIQCIVTSDWLSPLHISTSGPRRIYFTYVGRTYFKKSNVFLFNSRGSSGLYCEMHHPLESTCLSCSSILLPTEPPCHPTRLVAVFSRSAITRDIPHPLCFVDQWCRVTVQKTNSRPRGSQHTSFNSISFNMLSIVDSTSASDQKSTFAPYILRTGPF